MSVLAIQSSPNAFRVLHRRKTTLPSWSEIFWMPYNLFMVRPLSGFCVLVEVFVFVD